jgi:hypothetical protein
MPWPHPADGNLVCCDDFQPCFCYCADWDDYDQTKKQREERLLELQRFENAPDDVKQRYYDGRLKWSDVVRPIPPPERRYPRYTWRTTDNIENILHDVTSKVALCPKGERNNTLNNAAYFIGKLVQSGKLDLEHAVYRLGQAARDAHLPLHEAVSTVRCGLNAGMRAEVDRPYEHRPSAIPGRTAGTTKAAIGRTV